MIGTILARPLDLGQVIGLTDVIFQMGSVGPIKIEAEVDEFYADDLQVGMTTLMAPSGSGAKAAGRITEISPWVDPRTGGRLVRFMLAGANGDFRPGRSIDVSISVNRFDRAISVPRSALKKDGAIWQVYQIVGGKIAARTVTFVDWPGSSVIIRSGVQAGDCLVLDPIAVAVGSKAKAKAKALMPFVIKVAWRHLTANLTQTALLVLGVALSVVVFVFITALINGLGIFLTAETTGKIAHVELEPPTTISRTLMPDGRFAAQPVSTIKRKQICNWQQIVDVAGSIPGVIAISPTIDGSGFLLRGESVLPVAVQGTDPTKIDAISGISQYIVEGTSDLSSGGLVIGVELAEDLGLRVGTPVFLRSERGAERLIAVTGIFKIGLSSLDKRVVFISIRTARPFFALPEGVTSISIKLSDPTNAPQVSDSLRNLTGLKVTPRQDKNTSLQGALDSQGRTGNFIQAFALIAIIISIASALLLTTYRRRAEIGIMRAAGISRSFVAGVFVLQGVFIGMIASFIGALAGYQLCVLLATLKGTNGRPLLPIAPSEGGYLLVITLTILGAALAAIMPARAAAAIDPVEAIQQ